MPSNLHYIILLLLRSSAPAPSLLPRPFSAALLLSGNNVDPTIQRNRDGKHAAPNI